MPRIRQLPSESRRRGHAPVGFELEAAGWVVAETPPKGAVAQLVEVGGDGRRVGVLTVELVAVRLIIDRDGVLAQLAARKAPTAVAYPVELAAGAAGYRADVVRGDREDLRYQSWFALAPVDAGVGGAVLVTVESTAPEWEAALAMLATVRVFARDADARAATEPGAGFPLPLIKPSGS